MRQSRAAISFSALQLGQLFKAKSELTTGVLAADGASVAKHIRLRVCHVTQALAASAKMFDDVPLRITFSPKGIGKITQWAKYLYRLAVRVRFHIPHLRVKDIKLATSVIENQAVFFVCCQAQAPTNNLLKQTH